MYRVDSILNDEEQDSSHNRTFLDVMSVSSKYRFKESELEARRAPR